jgi:alpha-glucosidase
MAEQAERPWVSAGSLEDWRHDPRSVTARYDGAAVRVTFLAPGIVRIGIADRRGFAPRRSWAVAASEDDFPPCAFRVDRVDGGLRVASEELAVVFEPEGARISIFDCGGEPLLLDPPDGGPRWAGERSDWAKAMPDGERYYGFGERTGLLEKRGRRYTCWTTDEWRHQGPSTDELYVAVPFFLGLSENGRAYGVLLDNTFRTRFDLTAIHERRLRFESDGGALDHFVLAGPEPARVVERLSEVVGRMPLPPLWALGYHQSRWGYGSAEEVLGVVRELRARRFPVDAVHLDIDHMDGARIFTWDPETFPRPDELVRELAGLGVRTVCLVSAGVHYQPEGGYDVYTEGHRRGVFLPAEPDAADEELTAHVWPGLCVFPDHVRPDVGEWWGELYRAHVELGVAGFVNDMNEPAMHDLPMDDPASRNVEPPSDVPHGPPDERVTHAEARNVYALLENRSTYRALRSLRPDARPFLLTRAGFAGVQRYAGVWTGDSSSLWEHLESSLPELLNLGLSGIPFAGADIGGFFESCGPELMIRWLQLGALTPFARNHSARDTAPQEPWAWGPEVEEACRRAIDLRYRLLPTLYTLLEEASRTGLPVLRPLFLHHVDDPRTFDVSDQALLGRDLLLAPVVRPGQEARIVYLPAGGWVDVRDGSCRKGPAWIPVSARLDEDIPLFARAGSVVVSAPAGLQSTAEATDAPLVLDVYPESGSASGTLYEDDGLSFAHERGESARTTLEYHAGVLSGTRRGLSDRPEREVRLTVHEPARRLAWEGAVRGASWRVRPG